MRSWLSVALLAASACTPVQRDPMAREYDDPDHSEKEPRFLLVGHSLAGRVLLVVHAEKNDTIRIISARRATAREREDYQADARRV